MDRYTLQEVLINNVVCHDISVTHIDDTESCGATVPMSLTSDARCHPDVYGRLIEAVSLIVMTEKPLVIGMEAGWKFITSQIPSGCIVTLEKDFIPNTQTFNSNFTKIVAGDHDPRVLVDLEPSCTSVCSFLFSSVVVVQTNYKGIEIAKIFWENITFEIKDKLVLDDIKVITGCPNYG